MNLDGDCDDLLAPDQDEDEWQGSGGRDDTLNIHESLVNMSLAKGLKSSLGQQGKSGVPPGGLTGHGGAAGFGSGASALQALGLGLTPAPPDANARKLSYSAADMPSPMMITPL